MERKIQPVFEEDAIKGMNAIRAKVEKKDEASMLDAIISRVEKGTKPPEIGLEIAKNVLDQQKRRKRK